jgi:hypothetical protein
MVFLAMSDSLPDSLAACQRSCAGLLRPAYHPNDCHLDLRHFERFEQCGNESVGIGVGIRGVSGDAGHE